MSPDAFLTRFVEWAGRRDDVHGALLVGSRARSERPADRFSDIDLVLVVDEPDRYLRDERWLETFGRPLLSLVEATPVGEAVERRVLYDDGLDVDVAVFSLPALERAAGRPDAAGVLARGHRVLLDRAGLAGLAAHAARAAAPARPLQDSRTLAELGADFWYHALWAARKLARGELLTATRSVDGYLNERLIALVGHHAQAADAEADVWHEARFFEVWAGARAGALLRDTYARYDEDDVARALNATVDAFELLERETWEALGLDEPARREEIRALIAAALADR